MGIFSIFVVFSAWKRPGKATADLQMLQAAMDDWEEVTCLNFRQATSSDHNKIYIHSGSGCNSYIGMVGDQQKLSLGPGCLKKGVITHELGHAIGFYHEQSRADRDDYVTIVSENIREGKEFNFQTYPEDVMDTHSVPYDYTSIMHYGEHYFSSNAMPTIITLDSSKQHLIGNRDGLSFRDIKLANLMYNCGGEWQGSNVKLANLMYECGGHCALQTCPGEAFVGKDCQCWCPGEPVKRCDRTDTGVIRYGNQSTSECTDDHKSCRYWAATGECIKKSTYMLKTCRLSCGVCEGVHECIDLEDGCGGWANRSLCSSPEKKTFMEAYCPKSCGLCSESSQCTDDHKSCRFWAATGECTKKSTYMLKTCRLSCGVCEGVHECIDLKEGCGGWASLCSSPEKKTFMEAYCPKSCGLCAESSPCRDLSEHCSHWSRLGHCYSRKYRTFMEKNCPLTCDYCV